MSTTESVLKPASTGGWGARLAERALAILEAMARNSHGARCAREAKRLFALDDAELARLGLTRDRIIAHAFRGSIL